MKHCFKKITGNEIVEFFLNPFERSTQVGDFIVQKYPIDMGIDELFRLRMDSNDYYKIGYVLYEQNKVIVRYMGDAFRKEFEEGILEKEPFISIVDVKNDIQKMILNKIEDAKNNKLKDILSDPKYAGFYDTHKNEYFEPIVFSLLGTSSVKFKVKSNTRNKVNRFIDSQSRISIINIMLGERKEVDFIVNEIVESINFIITDIILEKIKEEAKEHVQFGTLSIREQTVNDFLEKTADSGATRFTVETLSGRKISCRNQVDYKGMVPSVESESIVVDIEDIKAVKYCNKVIYKKLH